MIRCSLSFFSDDGVGSLLCSQICIVFCQNFVLRKQLNNLSIEKRVFSIVLFQQVLHFHNLRHMFFWIAGVGIIWLWNWLGSRAFVASHYKILILNQIKIYSKLTQTINYKKQTPKGQIKLCELLFQYRAIAVLFSQIVLWLSILRSYLINTFCMTDFLQGDSIIGAGKEITEHNGGLFTGFTTSFLAILVSEIGDKTFFLAMIMAMRYNKIIVFLGAYGALFVMTILSAVGGKAFAFWLSPKITNILVTIMFIYFGGKMIYESTQTDDEEENEQLKEVEVELQNMESKFVQRSKEQNGQELIERSEIEIPSSKRKAALSNTYILTQAFIMTFCAEWGDRSQFATIALAASFNLFMVTLGALIGHCLCTAGAVRIGQWISGRVSEKYVLLVGGIVFILSGLVTLVMVFQQ